MKQATQPPTTNHLDAQAPGPKAWLPIRILRRGYRLTRAALVLIALTQILLVLTPAVERLYAWLDVTKPPAKADYIVCLGGNPARLLWAVDAYRRGFAPKVIVSNHPVAAEWMHDTLIQCGIPRDRIMTDSTSGTTEAHPAGIDRLPGIDPQTTRLLIVTSHHHSRRAADCFAKAGYRHFSVFGAGFLPQKDVAYFMRVRSRLQLLPHVLYEYVGLVQYWLMGRI
ncbi:MAG: YdcF family protein [Phycisphaerae bacterium]|nr:YdcF family protein [Phycisphaerae bacterium]